MAHAPPAWCLLCFVAHRMYDRSSVEVVKTSGADSSEDNVYDMFF